MTITPEEVAKLAAAATPGPWWTDGKYNGSEMGCAIIAARTDCGPLPGNPTRGMVAWASAILNTQARRCEANAAFIAAAHDMAALIADLEAKLANAVAALTFYSCEDGCNECPESERDRVSCGWTARAALAAIKENDNG